MNYFTGSDSTRWHTDVRTFATVRAHGVYSGIDVLYYGYEGRLEYDFVVAPGADPSRIRLEITGASKVSVLESGAVAIGTPAGELRQQAPRLYQNVNGRPAPVSGGFRVLEDNRIGIAVGGYDPALPLVIDPVIQFDTTLRGSTSDNAEDIAVDAIGATYVTGTTTSVDFPTSAGPLEGSRGTGQDVFVSKLDPSGQVVLFSAYVGGTADERGRAIAVAADGSVVISGDTVSPDFPTLNALQATLGGSSDGFVTRLAGSGTTLTFSTYLGGRGPDKGYDIAVDSDGSIVLCGLASSTFPVHLPLFGFGGIEDAFLARLTPGGSALVFSTFFGGSTFDSALSLSIDGEGNLFIVGETDARFSSSPVIPLPRVNAAQPMYGGGLDAFAAKFSPNGQQLLFSTPIGGRNEDYAIDSCVDATGALYVVGSTSSPDFPVRGPIASTNTGGASKGFFTKLTASGYAMSFSRFVGGSGADVLTAVTRLANGHIAAFGRTTSTDLEIVNAFDSELGGLTDGLIVEFSPTDGAILTQSYFGSELAENFGPCAAEPTGGSVAALNVDVSPAVNPELGLGGSTEVRVVHLFLENGDAPPMPPSSLSAVPTAPLRISLAWTDASENETAFAVERRDGPLAPWLRVGLTEPNVEEFHDNTVSASTSYWYRVRALAGVDQSQPSVEAAATSNLSSGIPVAPAFLLAMPVAGPHVAVGWSDMSRDETGFEIERRLEPAGAWGPVGTVGAGVASFRDTTLPVPAILGYRVRALGAFGPSEWSNVSTVETVAPPTAPPSAPLVQQALSQLPSQVLVSWTAASDTVTSYRVERRDGADPTWRVIRGVPATTTWITDPYVKRDVTYTYRLRYANSGGVSLPSPESGVTVVPPPAPTSVVATETEPGLVQINVNFSLGQVTGVVYERRTHPAGTFEQIGTTFAWGQFPDQTVMPDTTYTYRVRLYYASFPDLQEAIFSDPSNESTVTTSGPGTSGATVTVTSESDGNVRDGAMTLREAILVTDGTLPVSALTPQERAFVSGTPRLPGLDTIAFAIPGVSPHTIAVSSVLPDIVDAVDIDATTQPGYTGTPRIEVYGRAVVPPGTSGIVLLADHSRIDGLAVGGFTGNGIVVRGDECVVSRCHVGVGHTGKSIRTNGLNGILVSSGRASRVQACLVSGNSGAGIVVTGGTTRDTRVVSSRIGVNAPGVAALPNGEGIRVGDGAVGTIIGGTDRSERCIISGNSTHGVNLVDGVGAKLQNNYIGLSESGLGPLPNAGDGIHATDGGADISVGNVISANGKSGCRLSQVTSTGVGWATIRGSSFGVAADGRSVLGNGEYGIVIVNGRADIGSTNARLSNTIAGNGLGGILLLAGTSPSSVLGNYIGTNASGDVLGQPGDGIRIVGAVRIAVGNGGPSGRNTIAHTGGAGVAIPAGAENWLRWNVIHATGGLPIDLGPTGPTLNDDGDADTGANGLQNAPVLTGALRNGAETVVTGSFDGLPETEYRIELVERMTWPATLGPLAYVVVETDEDGHSEFAVSFVATMQPGARIAASAAWEPNFQPANGETSELSNTVPVQGIAHGSDTPGIFVAGSAAFFLANANAAGSADIVYSYGAAPSPLVPIVGDWNGDGIDTGGLYDPATGAFFLRNTNSPGPADLVFTYGGGGLGLVPLAGDWNGDGVDTVSLYAPLSGAFFLRNSNSPGNADLVFTFGAGGAGIVPVTGDWNADGVDTVGIYSTASGAFFLRNTNNGGPADLVFTFGAGGAEIVPVRGDWNGDGMDSIGIYSTSNGFWFLRNVNASGPADVVFGYGPPAIPLSGDWDGPPIAP